MLLRLVTFFIFVLIYRQGNSQSTRFLSTKDGLPQSFVSGVLQDSTGYMWLGTRNGLARYDGISFKTFQHNAADPGTLASNLIISLKSFHGKIWIEYESGEIDQFDPVTEKVSHYLSLDILKKDQLEYLRRSWIIDSAGNFLATSKSSGLLSFNPESRQASWLWPNGMTNFWALTQDHQGKIWALSETGLLQLKTSERPEKKLIASIPLDFHEDGDTYWKSVRLYLRQNGEWMWGDRHALYFFSPKTNAVRSLPLEGKSNYGILWIAPGPDGGEYFEREGVLYHYDEKEGLSILNTAPAEGREIVQSFTVDRSGMLWLGTNAMGVILFDLNTPLFTAYPNRNGFAGDILQKEFGISLRSVFGWTPDDDHFSSPGYHIRSKNESDGTLWVGLKETVIRYDPKTKSFTRYPDVPEIVNQSEAGIGIKGISSTPAGIPVVIGYNGNAVIFDEKQKKWELLLNKEALRHATGRIVTPRDILCDADRLWISTEKDGLAFMELNTGKVHHLPESVLPTNQLLGFCQDPTRPYLLWIGSYNGLIQLDKRTLQVTVFNEMNGLPDNTVYSLLADTNGFLWFGTNKGLCRFHPKTHETRIFQTRHGLPEDEFNRFHQLRLPDGRLAFGGTNGWTLFNPHRIKDDFYTPEVALTGLKVNNTEVIPHQSGLLAEPVNSLSQLVLPYDQNTVTLSFAGLQFNQPKDLNYRYQLVGYDRDWIDATALPQATYTKVPPGRYVFRVEAGNTAGRWSGKIKELPLVVEAPWWRTWWAFLLFALLAIGALWYWFRLKLARLELQKSIELKQQEASQLRKLAEMKTRFFTNITHDFRTPLTLILSPLSGLIDNQPDAANRKKLSSIQRNAEQLLKLINQLLDFSKLDAEVITVDESRGNLTTFTGTVVQLFREEAARRGITLSFTGLSGDHDHYFDAAKLERILANLIGNALKFTPSGGTVSISIRENPTETVFEIMDTGMGISPEHLPYLFDRYYQGAGTGSPEGKQEEGTGIGLAFVKELVELQQGRVEVESEVGRGSIFRVSMPLHTIEPVPEDSPDEATITSRQFPSVDQESVRILLAEDNAELAEFIADSLPGQYEIILADNGATGFQLALEHIPDLVISDVMMPVMNGFELCHELKLHEQTNHIPVILLTARAGLDSRMEGLSSGADDYLSKPFHVPELNLRVHNLLQRQIRLREKVRKELSAPPVGSTTSPSDDPFLDRFYTIVEQNLENSAMGVEELAACMNISRSQLHRKLKAVTGMTVVEVIRNYRLKRAGDFLSEGFNSSESAYRSGFDSPAYFSKCFKEYYGKTPTAFASGK